VCLSYGPVNFFFTHKLDDKNAAFVVLLKDTFLCFAKDKLYLTSYGGACLATLTFEADFEFSLIFFWL